MKTGGPRFPTEETDSGSLAAKVNRLGSPIYFPPRVHLPSVHQALAATQLTARTTTNGSGPWPPWQELQGLEPVGVSKLAKPGVK